MPSPTRPLASCGGRIASDASGLCGCNDAAGTTAGRRCRRGLFGVCGVGSPCVPVVDATAEGPCDELTAGGPLGVPVPPVPALQLAAPATATGPDDDWPDRVGPREGDEQLTRQFLLLPVVASVAPTLEPTLTVTLTLRLVPPRPGFGCLPCRPGPLWAELAELPVAAWPPVVALLPCLGSRVSACSLSASVASILCRTVEAVEARLVLLAALTNGGVLRWAPPCGDALLLDGRLTNSGVLRWELPSGDKLLLDLGLMLQVLDDLLWKAHRNLSRADCCRVRWASSARLLGLAARSLCIEVRKLVAEPTARGRSFLWR
mmetsp:Transcript_35357/g.68150  ORF Transcript_35357/g.68150 Transcript_35357/m.68150 type:complete len:318 (+) Transcript_35357:497-1450(+)